MYNNSIERNATRRRHTALILAIGLHLALAAALYYASTEHTVEIEKPKSSVMVP